MIAATAVAAALALQLAPPAYPLADVLDAARATCAPVVPLARFEAELPAQDWQPYTPEADGWLDRYIDSNAGFTMHRTWSRRIAGRTLIAYIAEIRFDLGTMGAGSGISCEIFEPDAPAAFTPDDIRRWARRAPTRNASSGATILMRWEPGLTLRSDETRILFVPPASALAQRFRGLIYSTNARLSREPR